MKRKTASLCLALSLALLTACAGAQPSPSVEPSVEPSATPAVTESATPEPSQQTPSESPSAAPSAAPSEAPDPSESASVKPSESAKPSATPKPSASAKPSATPKPSEKPAGTLKPLPDPEASATPAPTPTPTPEPTATPSAAPADGVDLAAFYADVTSQYEFGFLELADKGLLDGYYSGLTGIDTEQCLVYICMLSMNNGEVGLVQVKDSKDVDAVKAVFQNRIDYMVGDGNGPGGAWYPGPTELWTNYSRVVSNGNYVMMVVHENCDDIVSQFNALF